MRLLRRASSPTRGMPAGEDGLTFSPKKSIWGIHLVRQEFSFELSRLRPIHAEYNLWIQLSTNLPSVKELRHEIVSPRPPGSAPERMRSPSSEDAEAENWRLSP